MAVGVHGIIITRKGADKHYKCAFGQVEISDNAVHTFKGVPGVDKNGCIARAFFYFAILRGNAFNRSAGGGAYTDYPAAAFLGFIYYLGRLARNIIMLGVHMVVFYILGLNGAKSSKPYMQGNIGDFNTLLLCFFKQFFCKMKTRSRCRGGAEFF